MKQRIITGIIFTLVIALFILPGLYFPWISLILLVAVCLISVYELLKAAQAADLEPCKFFVYAGALGFLLPLLAHLLPDSQTTIYKIPVLLANGFALFAFYLLSLMILNLILPIAREGEAGLPSMLVGSMTMAYVAFPLACAVQLLYAIPYGWYWLVLALLTPWASDVTAYFIGTALGKHKLIPKISPHKTIEGFFGGILGSVVILLLYFHFILKQVLPNIPHTLTHLLFAVAGGVVLSIASQVGDWLASAIKRKAGIKDFGNFMPGHGGIMDRFDSAYFTMPATLLLAILYAVMF